jgi:hypothetical protein
MLQTKVSQTLIIGALGKECMSVPENVTSILPCQEFGYATLRSWYAGGEQLGNPREWRVGKQQR